MEKEIEQLRKRIMVLEEGLGDAETQNWRLGEKIQELESRIDWAETCLADI